jgi:hypothetical protein
VKRAAALALATLLAACATTQARLHSLRELSGLATRCDVASHTLAQHQERPELFYFLDPTASEAQLLCVGRWAKKNHLRLVYVEAVQEEPEAQP